MLPFNTRSRNEISVVRTTQRTRCRAESVLCASPWRAQDCRICYELHLSRAMRRANLDYHCTMRPQRQASCVYRLKYVSISTDAVSTERTGRATTESRAGTKAVVRIRTTLQQEAIPSTIQRLSSSTRRIDSTQRSCVSIAPSTPKRATSSTATSKSTSKPACRKHASLNSDTGSWRTRCGWQDTSLSRWISQLHYLRLRFLDYRVITL